MVYDPELHNIVGIEVEVAEDDDAVEAIAVEQKA